MENTKIHNTKEKDYVALLRNKILEQREIYYAFKTGKNETVCYKEYIDDIYGTQDANYINRLRMACFLFYEKIDDEEMIVSLFQEELKDRTTNSFQGIGLSLEVLTCLLKKYNSVPEKEQIFKKNADFSPNNNKKRKSKKAASEYNEKSGKYDDLFLQAKNANFDCACGYSTDIFINNDLNASDLLDCIFLSQDLDYKDVMDLLVAQWRDSVTEWDFDKRETLIRFYSFLEKETKNIELYQKQLESVLSGGKVFDIVSAYCKIIRCFTDIGEYKNACCYLNEVLKTVDYRQVCKFRLFGDLLEAAFELIQKNPEEKEELWNWAKNEFEQYKQRYRNLYKKAIAAAESENDLLYAENLQKEYKDWWESTRIVSVCKR